MTRILHLRASPRTESFSTRAAEAFLAAYARRHPGATVDRLDLFAQDVPPFEAPAAEAKYAVLSGRPPAGRDEQAWKQVIAAVERFKAAGLLVLSCPMWNFSIPYRLKQYLDVIVQPGLTFSYSPEKGYTGLVTGRPAVLVLARGGSYPPGSPGKAMDVQGPYLRAILGFIGFTDIRQVLVEPTLQEGPEAAQRALQRAQAAAEELAGQW